MAKFQSPLLGYNNNVRHRGRTFHIQTEDSGVNHPHIITHLFMDGGRILKSVKKSYAEHVGSDGMSETVRVLMKEQHKAMFIALRDGQFDDLFEGTKAAAAPATKAAPPVASVPPPVIIDAPVADVAASAAPATSPDPARPDELAPLTIDERTRASAPPPATDRSDDAASASAAPAVVPPGESSGGPELFVELSDDSDVVLAVEVAAAEDRAASERPRKPEKPEKPDPQSVTDPSRTLEAVDAVTEASEENPKTTREPERRRQSAEELTLDFDALERDTFSGVNPLFHRSDLPPPPENLFTGAKKLEPGTGTYRTIESEAHHDETRAPATGRALTPSRIPPAQRPQPRTPLSGAPGGADGRPAARSQPQSTPRSPSQRAGAEGRYAPARPAAIFGAAPKQAPPTSIFGDDLVSDKSLDEVILSYLAEDLDPPRRK